ncbi:DEAD/DEAH box helicase [Bacillus haimaensis]|uniref:DEAD/DEAH box helicase n=1 Tax=Bacillus haimaensis TaxID=3160967 RepID=UPI003AA802EA
MNNEQAFGLLQKIETDKYLQNLIAQGDSRFLLFNIKEKKENFPNYTDNLDEKLTQIAVSYLSVGCYYAENNDIENAIFPLEKGANILESVHRPIENRHNYSLYFILASSLAYYGAQQYSKSFTILKDIDFDTNISKLISCILKRKYSELHSTIINIILSDDYSDLNISVLKDDKDRDEKIYTYLIAKSLSMLLEYFYSGEKVWLSRSIEVVEDLLKLVIIDKDPGMWWVIRLFKLIISGYEKNSLWGTIPPLIGAGGGVVSDYILSMAFQSKPVVELFKAQQEALPKVLNQDGAVVSLPTSSGKTRIAELAILQCLNSSPDNVILYLAPFRSLAHEIEDSLTKVFRPMGFEVSHLYGGAQYSKLDELLINETNIIIATPEKAKAIIRNNSDVKAKIKLVIIDEGHLIGSNNRYTMNEIFIEELRFYLNNNNGKMILLSAVLPNGKLIAKWISGDSEAIITSSNHTLSKQRFGLLFFRGNNVSLKWKGDLESFNHNFIEPFVIQRPRSKYNFPSNKKEAIAATALRLSEIGSVLIFVARQNMVLSQAREVLISMRDNNTHEWTNLSDWEAFLLACEEAYGKDSDLKKYAQFGIVCHHSGLATEVRTTMERLMRNGNPKVIIATTTLGQGVNIGVYSVIFANVWLNDGLKITTNDFWNIAGRAGRTFVDSEGKILYALDGNKPRYNVNKQLRLANEYIGKLNQSNVNSGLLVIIQQLIHIAKECDIEFDLFLQLVAESNYRGIAEEKINQMNFEFDLIDDTLLALSEEFQSYNEVDRTYWVDDYFRKSLAYIEAQEKSKFDENKICLLLKARTEAVQRLAGDRQNWKGLISSSLPLRSGIKIKEQIQYFIEIVNIYLNSDRKIEDMITLLSNTEHIIQSLPSKQFEIFSDIEEINEVRILWITGCPLFDINLFERYKKYFTFTLPWGINAVARLLESMDFKEESEVFGRLAMLVQVGLPNILSLNFYLSGIYSRSAAVELAEILNNPKLEKKEIREIKDYLIQYKDTSLFSENTKKWLFNLKETHGDFYQFKDKVSNFKFVQEMKIQEDVLLVKKIGENLFLCSPSFQDKIPVQSTEELPFENLSNNNGVYFIRQQDGSWEMKIRNPYIKENSYFDEMFEVSP